MQGEIYGVDVDWRDFDGREPICGEDGEPVAALFDVTDDYDYDGRTSGQWAVALVTEEPFGYGYGRDDYGDKPIIEFYDASHGHGQFVSAYYMDTLNGSPHDYGIDLMGDVDAWKIGGKGFAEIMDWANGMLGELGLDGTEE